MNAARSFNVLLVGGLAVGGVVAYVALTRGPGQPEPAATSSKASVGPVAVVEPASPPLRVGDSVAAVEPPVTPEPPEIPPAAPAAHVEPALDIPASTGQSASPTPAQPAGQSKRELVDPVARVALFFVGADPEAEGYWYAAINDPSLPPGEREDLIEDLNEEGLSDPQNPGPEDLPLLLNRLDVIERYAPYAMDEVNADAFQEAYKDLVNLVLDMPQ